MKAALFAASASAISLDEIKIVKEMGSLLKDGLISKE